MGILNVGGRNCTAPTSFIRGITQLASFPQNFIYSQMLPIYLLLLQGTEVGRIALPKQIGLNICFVERHETYLAEKDKMLAWLDSLDLYPSLQCRTIPRGAYKSVRYFTFAFIFKTVSTTLSQRSNIKRMVLSISTTKKINKSQISFPLHARLLCCYRS